MKLKNQVVSLELAKEMKELGFKQESLWWCVWKSEGSKEENCVLSENNYLMNGKKHNYGHFYMQSLCSAYTVAELGEMLPKGYYTFYSEHFETWACFSDDEEFNNKESIKFIANTEANARAKMLIYLKKENLIEKKGKE